MGDESPQQGHDKRKDKGIGRGGRGGMRLEISAAFVCIITRIWTRMEATVMRNTYKDEAWLRRST